ncbi:hypothetical protein ACJJTC_015333 [Scirpophaga incertulas]
MTLACINCNTAPKYKCPVCRHPYCSVACYKTHKENPCSAPVEPIVDTTMKSRDDYEYPTEDTVPTDKLQLLRNSKEVKNCLDNPHVREILTLLDKSPYPDELMQEYMQEPIFTEFVDACLSVIETPDDCK